MILRTLRPALEPPNLKAKPPENNVNSLLGSNNRRLLVLNLAYEKAHPGFYRSRDGCSSLHIYSPSDKRCRRFQCRGRLGYKRDFIQPPSEHESFSRSPDGSYYQLAKVMLPNEITSLDAAMTILQDIGRHWRGASEFRR